MRAAFQGGLLCNKDGRPMGYNLGADCCAEHEWGIKGIRSAFGMDENGIGIAKRTVTCVPIGLELLERDNSTALIYHEGFAYGATPEERTRRAQESKDRLIMSGDLRLLGKPTSAAWDAKSFGIHTKDAKLRKFLVELYEALQRKDAAIWLGGGGVFENAGLVVVIVSRIPAEALATMRGADEDRVKLLEASASTGIEEVLRKADRGYFALSPKWKFGDKKSKFPVMYWLNPREQHIYEAGWYTVEDLRAWAQGQGPVVKRP